MGLNLLSTAIPLLLIHCCCGSFLLGFTATKLLLLPTRPLKRVKSNFRLLYAVSDCLYFFTFFNMKSFKRAFGGSNSGISLRCCLNSLISYSSSLMTISFVFCANSGFFSFGFLSVRSFIRSRLL